MGYSVLVYLPKEKPAMLTRPTVGSDYAINVKPGTLSPASCISNSGQLQQFWKSISSGSSTTSGERGLVTS